MLQEGQSVLMNRIFQSVAGGKEGGNNLDIVECNRRDSL